MIVYTMKTDIFEVVKPEESDVAAVQLTLVDQVASAIREWIFSGRLAPTERVREELVAEKLKVSRGPVRDALKQLRSEGLVTTERNRGCFVSLLTHEDLNEIYQLRTVLERLAVKSLVERLDSATIDALDQRVKAIKEAASDTDTDALLYADIAFHQELYIRSGSRRLFETWITLRSQIAFALKRRQETTSRYRALMAEEHQEILDLIKSEDKQAAAASIEAHIRSAYERVFELEMPSERSA